MGDVVRVGKVPSTMPVSARGEKMPVPWRCIGRPARIVVMPGGAMDCYGRRAGTPPGRWAGSRPGALRRGHGRQAPPGDAAGDIEAARRGQPRAARLGRGSPVSAAVQASPRNRLAANLEEEGLDGMASSVPGIRQGWCRWREDLVTTMLELTDAQVAAKRAPTTAGASAWRTSTSSRRWPTSTGRSSPACARGLVEQLATLQFVERGDNVVLVGSPGVGKTAPVGGDRLRAA